MRGATTGVVPVGGADVFQSTRPIRGATLAYISSGTVRIFQSTRPIRGATNSVSGLMYTDSDFNPRAPYGARPSTPQPKWQPTPNFNPRAPYGARPWVVLLCHGGQGFQSTRPIRGATAKNFFGMTDKQISIHAPHTGRDVTARMSMLERRLFQSTRPIRGATGSVPAAKRPNHNFNPRAPYGARRHPLPAVP